MPVNIIWEDGDAIVSILCDGCDKEYEIISKDDDQFSTKISNVIKIAKNENRPVVLLIKKGSGKVDTSSVH